MGRGPKPTKGKAKPAVSRKSPKDDGARTRDLEKRLAEALRDKAEARAHQTATSEILRVISGSPTDVQPVFDAIVGMGARLCEADFAMLARYDGTSMSLAAHSGATDEEIDTVGQVYPMAPTPETLGGRTILERAVVHIPDVSRDPTYGPRVIKDAGWRTGLGVPLLREGAAIGAVGMWRRDVRPFTDRQIELLKTFADQAVIAIENVRLFNETKEALEQQTATSEILKVISSSPTDVQPTFEAIAESATRLCGAVNGLVFRFDGELIHVAAQYNIGGAELDAILSVFPIRPGQGSVAGRAIESRRIVHVEDLAQDPEYEQMRVVQAGFRTALSVPMMRGKLPIGAINVMRMAVTPFSPSQIALLQSFADQAVIAIENVRLFTELQEKNRALTEAHAQVTEALDQQTATSEILQTIAQAQTDVQPVFDTIVRSAAQLCGAHTTAVFLTDGSMVHHPASYGDVPEALAVIKTQFPRPLDRETAAGTAILTRSVIHVPDVEAPSAKEFARQTGRVIGFRSLLSVPMLRQGEAVGAINVTRREPGPFPETAVALLQTFADQAVIALENVRLFKELQAANRELAAASQHKSEFLANMSHELRTPLNAIIGFSEVLSEKMFGELNEKQEEYSKDIHASGQHLLSLINDILDLSKIEAGRMELELTDFHLPQALDSALTLVRERAGRRGIALQINVDERLGQIQGDERKVRQVVLNLLSNAIKFTPEGGRIEVAAMPRDGFAEVSVADTGVGIAPEDQEAVFEEFRQVGTADKKVEGTGLGLTLCRKFVELHGGKIWVKSQLGVGSTFTFTIPGRPAG
jgi:two-component system, NtrC family, sensor kinase